MVEKIKSTIEQAIPGADVYVFDPQNDNTHFESLVISEKFSDIPLVKQHKMVMSALEESFATDVHAMGTKNIYTRKMGCGKKRLYDRINVYEVDKMDENKLAETKELIKNDVASKPVLLYMKGDKTMPQCGFSARVVQILNTLEVDYETRNVLADEYIRQGIKEYSDWPTIPQLYVKGEFIGGCDIVAEMAENGDLEKLFKN